MGPSSGTTFRRYGVWLVAAGGFLTSVSRLAIHLNSQPDPKDEAAFAQFVSGPQYAIWNDLVIPGLFCALLGLIAVWSWTSQERASGWSTAAMIVGVMALVLEIVIWTVAAVAAPVAGDVYQGGQTGAGEVFRALSGDSDRIHLLFIVTAVTFLVAAICLGIATWRSQRVSRWAAVVLAIGFFLLIAPMWPLAIAGGLMLVVAPFGMATGERTSKTNAPAAVDTGQ